MIGLAVKISELPRKPSVMAGIPTTLQRQHGHYRPVGLSGSQRLLNCGPLVSEGRI